MEVAHQWNRLARLMDPQVRKSSDFHYVEPPKVASLWKKIPHGTHQEVPYEQQQIDGLWSALAARFSTSEVMENWLSSSSSSAAADTPVFHVDSSSSPPVPSFSSSSLSLSSQSPTSTSSASLPQTSFSQPSSFSQSSLSQTDYLSFSSTPSIFSCSTFSSSSSSSSSSQQQETDEVTKEDTLVTDVKPEGKAAPLTSEETEKWASQEEEVGRVLPTGDVSNHLAFKEAILKLQGLPADAVEIDLARIQGRGPNFNEFLVEHAKSGRATCSSCRKPIDQGTLRVANTYFAVGFDGNKYYWRHWWCFARSQKNVNRPEQWDGWNKLKDADKEKIKKLVPRPVAYGLTRVPGLLSCFRHVQKLDLRENSLETLPEELSALKELEKIDLNHNQFNCIPEVLLTLPNLKWIDLRNNPVASSQDLAAALQIAKQRNSLLKIEI